MYEDNAKMSVQAGIGGAIGRPDYFTLQAQQAQPQRTPQVHVQLEILEKELACQRDVIERLSNRLDSVMSLEGPQSENPAKALRNEPTTALASRIDDITRRLAVNTALLESFVRRLEVWAIRI